MDYSGTTSGRRRLHVTLNAPVVLGFCAACLVATLLGQVTGGRATMLFFSTYRSSLLSPLTYLRLFTHVLGHAGWEHLTNNLIYILLLGPLLEEKYGSRMLLETIGVTAVVTALANALLFPRVMLCGASGVVFAFIVLSSLTGFREGEVPLTFVLVVVLFLGQELLQGILVQDDVANFAHIIGGVIGASTGFGLAGTRMRN